MPTVIDRWALSEAAYGAIYRKGPSYDTVALAQEIIAAYNPTFILCSTENAIGTHNRLKQERKEMFSDIGPVIQKFQDLVNTGQYGKYHIFDYNKVDVDEFLESILMHY